MKGEMNSQKLGERVIVANIFYGEAERIRQLLASVGIECGIHGSRTYGVEVAAKDKEQAIQLLLEYAKSRPYWITVSGQ